MTKHCCHAVFHGKSIIFIAIVIVFSFILFSIAAFCNLMDFWSLFIVFSKS